MAIATYINCTVFVVFAVKLETVVQGLLGSR